MFDESFRYFIILYLLEFLNLLFNRRYILLTFFRFYAPRVFFIGNDLWFIRYFAVNAPALLFFDLNSCSLYFVLYTHSLCTLYFVLYTHNLCTLYFILYTHSLSLSHGNPVLWWCTLHQRGEMDKEGGQSLNTPTEEYQFSVTHSFLHTSHCCTHEHISKNSLAKRSVVRSRQFCVSASQLALRA